MKNKNVREKRIRRIIFLVNRQFYKESKHQGAEWHVSANIIRISEENRVAGPPSTTS